MPDYITIISQEIKYCTPSWVAWLCFGICAAILIIPSVISWILQKGMSIKVLLTEMVSGVIAMIACCIITPILCDKFNEPSGKYKYEATLDKTKVTVAQYEEFIEKYKPEVKDGIYYFEGDLLNE